MSNGYEKLFPSPPLADFFEWLLDLSLSTIWVAAYARLLDLFLSGWIFGPLNLSKIENNKKWKMDVLGLKSLNFLATKF